MSAPTVQRPPLRPVFGVENPFERLVVIWAHQFHGVAELRELGVRYLSLLKTLGGTVVMCADYRRLDVLAPDVCDALVAFTRDATPQVEASAIIIPSSATLALQYNRVLKEAPHPSRRLFAEPYQAKAWLSGMLSVRERAALETFLMSRPER